MKKVGIFLALFGYVIGAIGGTCLAFKCGEYVIALCVALVSYMAFDKAKVWWRYLNS